MIPYRRLWRQRHEQQHGQRKTQEEYPKSTSISTTFCSSSSSYYAVIVLIVIASLDNADKQLLASSYTILEQTLGWNVEQLGYFSLVTNLSYALSLPLWGYWIHQLTTTATTTKSLTTATNRSTTNNDNNVKPIRPLFRLLAFACTSWGVATIGIAIVTLLSSSSTTTTTVLFLWLQWGCQIVLRSLNGVALGSIIPLSQSLLVEITSPTSRGRTFGWLGVGEKLAGAISSSSVVYFANHWQFVYYTLGVTSIIMGYMASSIGPNRKSRAKRNDDGDDDDDTMKLLQSEYDSDGNNGEPRSPSQMEYQPKQQNPQQQQLPLRDIVLRIVRLPAFVCLVAQGIFGGTPWDMMSYLIMLMDWKGLTQRQIVIIQFTTGISSMVGGWFGGIMGDVAASKLSSSSSSSVVSSPSSRDINAGSGSGSNSSSSAGRIILAIISVVGGIPLYGLFLYSTNFHWMLLWSNLFHFWAVWTPSGAIRPICAELTSGPSERAQIVALWIVLEKSSGAIFGAPLVGYLTNRMLHSDDDGDNDKNYTDYDANLDGGATAMMTTSTTTSSKIDALAFNLFLLSSLFWGLCALFWFVMLVAMMKSKRKQSMTAVAAAVTETRSPRESSMSQRLSTSSSQNRIELQARI